MSYKKSSSLTIFANFFINNEERLQRMKDSFKSFENINPSEWVINIRGEYKFEAGDFLENEIGDKLFLSYYNSGYGWFYDSRKIYKNITSQFVMYWIEDHILLNLLKIERMDKSPHGPQINESILQNLSLYPLLMLI